MTLNTLMTEAPTTQTPTEPVVPEPVTTAPIDWTPHVPKGAEKVFEPYKGKPLTDVLNSVVESQKLIGNSLRLPKADATPEEKAKALGDIYAKLGRPEAPDKYDLGELPMISGTMKYDEARLNAAKGELFKLGLSNEQAKGVMQIYGKELQTLFPDNSKVAAESRAKLIEEFGSEQLFQRNMGMAHKTVKAYGDNEFVAFLEQTGLGNHPAMVKFMSKVGKELTEHGSIEAAKDSDHLSQADAMKEANKIINDPKDIYHARPGTPGKAERMKEVQDLFRIATGQA